MATSKVVYLGNLRTSAVHLKSGEKITTDAPPDNNGKGEYFSPTDLAATSLASCAITVMGIAAQRDGIDFSGSELEVTKIMSAELPRRIVEIQLNFNLITKDELSEEIKKKYIRIANTCPVSLSLHPDIKQVFTFSWQVK